MSLEPPFGYTKNDIKLLYVPPNMEEVVIWLNNKRFNAIKMYSKRTGIKDITLCVWFFFAANRQYILAINLMGMFLKGKTLEEILAD
jgi:hypothetical protein